MNVFPDILICPVCGAPLRRADGFLRCASGHTYDLSRSGYANLLPPGKGRNAKTGDERDMIRARASFLRKGFYDPMDEEAADRVVEMLSNYLELRMRETRNYLPDAYKFLSMAEVRREELLAVLSIAAPNPEEASLLLQEE